uniref:Piwi domain-containing protein n=1 Tax=Panagrolaimus sp. ES5 TaxID=591445 RepID=A0AC34GRN0_9BILA
MYPSEEFQIIPFQECSSNFWPSGVFDFVQKSNSEASESVLRKISSIIHELNFLNSDNNVIQSNWHTKKIETLKFPSILFRTESIIPSENGKFDYSINNRPLIYGTKTSLIILYTNETHLQLFKPLINSIAFSLSYQSLINVRYQSIKNTVQIHAEIIKCNSSDEMFLIIDGGNIVGLEETIIFAKTKKPDAAVFVLTLKKLKKLLNEKEMTKFQRILNIKMGGLNHTPNYDKFLAINTVDVKPNEILFLSHLFLPPQSSNIIGTTGFAFNYMPLKCQPIGQISFQFTNRTQFYSLHKFCESIISKIELQGVNFPKIVFIGTIDNDDRKEICEFNAKMDLNIIQKHFNQKQILIYLSFTKEHTFRAFKYDGNLQIGACIDDPIDENSFYLVTQQFSNSSSQPLLKVRILLNQPKLSKASIKYYIFTQCFCNQITLESDPYPATIMFSKKLAHKGVKVIEALKKHSPTSFSGIAEDDARYCNKAIAFQNIKYQCMDIDGDDEDENVENEKKIVKSRKT